MAPVIRIDSLCKDYDPGPVALDDVTLDIEEGEILALLGPSSGSVSVLGHDVIQDYRKARDLIGLVPQETMLEPFEKVRNTVKFSRGLFGKPPDDAHIEHVLRQLSLLDKKDSPIKDLSGGMKRRVLIAKALSHEPRILFLDEPTAGVDVELRKDMWEVVRGLKSDGVTIILTTHYIEEAEAIADRVGVIDKGRLLLVEEKEALMRRLGERQMRIFLQKPVAEVPKSLATYNLQRADDGCTLVYTYDTHSERTGITSLLRDLSKAGMVLRDVQTYQRSLEEIFVNLVKGKA